jgi:hypothetical protein
VLANNGQGSGFDFQHWGEKREKKKRKKEKYFLS